MKSLKCISIILLMLLLITACNSNTDIINEETGKETSGNRNPIDGGTITVSTTRFQTLNPLFNRNNDLFQIHHLLYESLVAFREDMSVKPLLAESWKFNGAESVDFRLRSGVKWHDGQLLTVDDVIFTFNVIKGNIRGFDRTSIYRESLENITGIVKIDENTIRVSLSNDVANTLETMTFPILPKHIFQDKQAQLLKQDDLNVVGTGMYKIKEYEKTRKISLVRNNDYWGNRPYIEEINVLIVPDEEAQLSLFENGDIDFVHTNIVDWGKYTDDKTIRHAEFIIPDYEFIGINFRKDILNDINVRKAIAYGIDREKIVGNIYLGHATVADYPVMPSSWLYDYGKVQLGFNPNLAATFLDKSGYMLRGNSNLRTNEKGEIINLKLITNVDNPLRDQTALFIQEDLNKIGVQLEIEFLEWDDLEERITTNSYDLFLGGWELSYIPNVTDMFHSSEKGKANFVAYNNEELDALLDVYLTDVSSISKEQRFSDIQEHIAKELPYISLIFKNGTIIMNKKIMGDLEPHGYNVFSNINNWYINTK
ncbi:MAG TPA: peptide ABC transporter substrate-binding protein [Clostridia bacterium]|nr:peptide ABC transporter substrate-binding protein [Clostridia bacterium]